MPQRLGWVSENAIAPVYRKSRTSSASSSDAWRSFRRSLAMRHSIAPHGPDAARMPFQEGGCRPRLIADGKQGSGNQSLGNGIGHQLFRRFARRRPPFAVAAGPALVLFSGLSVVVQARYPLAASAPDESISESRLQEDEGTCLVHSLWQTVV